MRKRYFDMPLSLLVLLTCICICPSEVLGNAPPTFEQELTRYGVKLTVPALRKALEDVRPVVRGLAAVELAARKDKDSIPLIREALLVEEVPKQRLNLATALSWLGDPEGHQALVDMCTDPQGPPWFRFSAAQQLFDSLDAECLSSLIDILSIQSDSIEPAMRISTLDYLARVKTVPVALMPKVHAFLLSGLQDQVAPVRQSAADCIAALGDQGAAAALRTAAMNESDSATRLHIERALKELASTQNQLAPNQ
jgi:HEAT repeat protein